MAEAVQPCPQLRHGSGGTGEEGRACLPHVATELFMEEFNLEQHLATQVVA